MWTRRNGARICSALAMAGGLLLGTGCQTMQQLDQGLYKVAEQVSETDRVSGQRSLSLAARGEQIAQGNRYVEALLAQEKAEGRALNRALDSGQFERLVRVFDRVHAVSHLRQERWQPILIAEDSFNAFTTGGTYIMVHLGLMRQLPDDDELAAVIGHEIAHTVANHVFERQSHAQLSALAGSKASRRGSYQAAFTHENEREADRIGILYSALAGFDPLAARDIWQRQYLAEGSARALRFHDHPVNVERQAEAERVGQAVLPYYTAGLRNPNYAALLQDNVLWRTSAAVAPGQGGGVAALFDTVLGAYLQHEDAKQEERRQQSQIRFIQAVEARMTQQQIKVLSPSTFEISWYYQGPAPRLQGVIAGLLVERNQQVERFVAHVPGSVLPERRFSARFSLPAGLTVEQLQGLPVRFYLDDAQPLP